MTKTEQEFLRYIGKRIATLRRSKDLTQVAVCALIDMEKTNLSAIENGRQNVTSLTLLKIANAIGVEVGDFFIPPKEDRDKGDTLKT